MSITPPTAKITPCLWFDDQAEIAAKYYVNLFNTSPHASKNSTSCVGHTTYYQTEADKHCHDFPSGTVLNVNFNLAGHEYMALNGGPMFKFSCAVSLMVECEDQDEIDHFYAGFGEGKADRVMKCGWINDRWGLSWQVVPKYMRQLAQMEDRTKSNRVHMWMMNKHTMPEKFILQDLMDAAEGGGAAAAVTTQT